MVGGIVVPRGGGIGEDVPPVGLLVVRRVVVRPLGVALRGGEGRGGEGRGGEGKERKINKSWQRS